MMKTHLSLCALLSLVGCTGTLSSPLGPGSGADGAGAGQTTTDGAGVSTGDVGSTRAPLCNQAGSADRPGPRLLRRLTKPEFEATIRSVFALDAQSWAGSTLPPDSAAQNGFTNQVDELRVGDSFAERLLESAESVGDAVSAQGQAQKLLPCVSTGGESCAGQYLDSIGKRLYRRPLTADERARYVDLLKQVTAAGGSFAQWMKWATAALVSSPNAVYRSEIGEPDGQGSYRLSAYERATALAFTFTGAPPDPALLALAEQGMLDDGAGLRAAAKDLVFDASGAQKPAFRAQFARFVNQWLGLSALDNRQKDTSVFPEWNDDVRNAMRAEVEAFVEHVAFDTRGGMTELLTAPYTLVNATLAKFYGFGTASSDALVMAQRPENWGVGLLSQGALLALKATNRDTSPTQRGHFVRERILCFDVPPPPPTVGKIPDPTGAETTRQRYEKLHEANASCAGCHRMMDPVGFGFEHLDATGRYRERENGFSIDDTGSIVATASGETDAAFKGPTELAGRVSEREAAGACFGAFYASFAFGLDRHDTTCLTESAREQLGQGKMGLLDFMLGLVDAPHFTTRAASQ